MTFKATYYRAGSWNAICDVCGQKYKAHELRKRWDGLQVCNADFESRHPQDLIRPIKERNSVPWTRPRPEDINIDVCTLSGINAVAGQAVAGCAVAGLDLGYPPSTEIVEELYPPTFNPNTL